MAAFLAELHQVDSEDLGILPVLVDPLPELPGFLAVDKRFAALRRWAKEARPRLFDGTLALLHGDFWPGNLRWEGEELVGVLDWEDCHQGDPMVDVAVTRLELYLLGPGGGNASPSSTALGNRWTFPASPCGTAAWPAPRSPTWGAGACRRLRSPMHTGSNRLRSRGCGAPWGAVSLDPSPLQMILDLLKAEALGFRHILGTSTAPRTGPIATSVIAQEIPMTGISAAIMRGTSTSRGSTKRFVVQP